MSYQRDAKPPAIAEPTLALPPVTRAYPPARQLDGVQPVGDANAAICDRGLLLVARANRIDMIDPTTRTIRTVVGDPLDGFEVDGEVDRVSINHASGLALDDHALWYLDRGRGALRRVDFASEAVVTIARDLPGPRHLARLGGTWYALGEQGELVAIDAETGAARTLVAAGAFARHHHGWSEVGLVAAGSRLYVAAEPEAIFAVDPETGAVEPWLELPMQPYALAVGGDALYVGASRGIWRVHLADRRCEQISPASVLLTARCVTWDGDGGVYFFDDARLGWLSLTHRRIVTDL